MESAPLIELFASYQGEGPYVGEPMAFVRFQDCDLACRFCDTPKSFKKNPRYRLENPPFSREFLWRDNPATVPQLLDALSAFAAPFLSLTGGEPLQHAGFLAALLPDLKKSRKILLETNGVLPEALEKVIEWVDVVSMDFKLPSVTGMRPYWSEHEDFLCLARRKEVYVKTVVGDPTDEDELGRTLDIIHRVAPDIPFVLQPVTPCREAKARIPEQRLKELYLISKGRLKDVRVIPQVHAQIGIL